jgi:hypothetical protein
MKDTDNYGRMGLHGRKINAERRLLLNALSETGKETN